MVPVAAAASAAFVTRPFGGRSAGFFPVFACGSPTSAPRGGGSGARSSPGSSRTPTRTRTTIAATLVTPRHLIRTSAMRHQAFECHPFSPYLLSGFDENLEFP
jgi:hypothetical protein